MDLIEIAEKQRLSREAAAARLHAIADALVARGLPFVFSTGYDKDSLAERYRTVPVLQKPYHQSELSDALATLWAPKEPDVPSVIAAGA